MPVSWWLAMIINCAATILLGEYICLKFEQKEIKIFDKILDIVAQESTQKPKKKEREKFELKEVITL